MDNKKIIRLAFCGILNNEGLGKCYQPWPWVWLITPTLTLTDITKTSLFHRWGEWQNDEQEWQNMKYSNIRKVLKHGIYRIF